MSIAGAALLPSVVGYVAKETNSYAFGYLAVAACDVAVAIYGRSARITADPLDAPPCP